LRLGDGVDAVVLALAGAHLVVCTGCLVEQRRGHGVRAATLFVVGQLLLLSITQGYWGLAALSRVQLVQVVPVLLVAAVLGAAPLRGATLWACLAMVLGAWIDLAGILFRADRVAHVVTDLAVCVFGCVLVAWLLHHSVTGLRESLQLARQHGVALARKRDELQLEMQEKERSRDQLVHAMKMDNVGRLASGIAHDFNHLLALVHGYVGKARRAQDPAMVAEALQGVDSATRRASAVSRRLLDFSRLEASRPQLLDAAATLEAMAPTLRQVFGEGVHCHVDTAQVQCLIHFDPAQLESILLSLAVNAGQAMPEGGRFALVLAWLPTVGELSIQATDTGQGMNEEVRARCMEPFFTTKPIGQGTGLGLAVSATLIAAAGGRIHLESRIGHGTCVDIRLPARAAPREQPS
jgi:signal transduction histidine kinase